MITKQPLKSGVHVSLFDMVMCLSTAVDLISPDVADHHKRVAYIASSLAEHLGLDEETHRDVILAAAMHDIGAVSYKERLDTLDFDSDNPHHHAELGYRHVSTFSLFADAANIIRYHHYRWDETTEFRAPDECYLLHLADMVATLVAKEGSILPRIDTIREKIKKQSGFMFMPKMVDAFMELSEKRYFWLDASSTKIDSVLARRSKRLSIDLRLDELLGLAKLFGRIIDFRSHFTAIHSSGVAASAAFLAGLAGMDKTEQTMMKVAGYLHDLGKLAIPNDILEKRGKLTWEEFDIVKNHPYYTYRTLETIEGLEMINEWASFHHERVDGKGYPFCRDEISLSTGAKILAVADVFTAITEERPYRQGMTPHKALSVLHGMAEDGALDSVVVWLLDENFNELLLVRGDAQEAELEKYLEFEKNFNDMVVHIKR